MPEPRPSAFLCALGSGLGTGYAPIASGTVASALAALLYLVPGCEHPVVLLPLIAVTLAVGIPVSTAMERHYGHDPAEVTIDEVAGMWISLLFLPKTIPVLIASFLLFRIFDIIKPYPAKVFDRMHGGVGIMLDDVVAAVYANAALQLLLLITPVRNILL